jgi:TM2 domain
MRAVLLFLLVFMGLHTYGAGPFKPQGTEVIFVELSEGDSLTGTTFHPSRALAVGLALTLGPFGAHRLYFGTTPKVPVLYALTFGGFGILVLIDIGHILFTKDLSAYLENDRVLMWAKPRSDGATPP